MDGILPLWKPAGMTSHDCVVKLRKLLKTKKVGHTGTLDPAVCGVLPICIGQATKVASYLTDANKEYEAEVMIGQATETEDQEGKIIDQKEITDTIQMDDLREVLDKFRGTITQIPPMYSAVKINGKRLYEYARAGLEVERPERQVTIYNLELLSNEITKRENGITFNIRVLCSKGTYIRTLCVDIGKALGYPAHMSHLVRTKAGTFSEKDTVTFEALIEAAEKNQVDKFLYPMEHGVAHLDELIIKDEADIFKFLNGQVMEQVPAIPANGPFRVSTPNGKLLALYQAHPTKPGLMKPVRVFHR